MPLSISYPHTAVSGASGEKIQLPHWGGHGSMQPPQQCEVLGVCVASWDQGDEGAPSMLFPPDSLPYEEWLGGCVATWDSGDD